MNVQAKTKTNICDFIYLVIRRLFAWIMRIVISLITTGLDSLEKGTQLVSVILGIILVSLRMYFTVIRSRMTIDEPNSAGLQTNEHLFAPLEDFQYISSFNNFVQGLMIFVLVLGLLPHFVISDRLM